jgi:tripartite-type tricarboxylate transporter receptor subunit TctC
VRRIVSGLLLALIGLALPIGAAVGQAQDFPNRTVTITTPYLPGGLGFQLAQVISAQLEKDYGKPFVVESKPGGNTVLGSLAVVNAAPDGHALLIATSSASYTIGTIYKKPPFDPGRDLVPVVAFATIPQLLLVNAELPIHSLADLAKLARGTPGGLSFGSIGIGSAQHLTGVLLKKSLDIPLTHVPYRGPLQALQDVAAGHIAFMFSDVLNALPLIQAGKLRAIGLSSKERLETMPDIPPLADVGAQEMDVSTSFVIFAPAHTPASILADLNTRINRVFEDAELRKTFVRQGVGIMRSPPPDALRAWAQSEQARWSKLVHEAELDGTQ